MSTNVLRVMTLNLWNSQGPYQERKPLIIQGLKDVNADIIGLQEVLDKTATEINQAEWIAKELGYHYVYQGATLHAPGLEGIGIVSRYPILESDSVKLAFADEELTRVLLRARIKTPHTMLNFYSTHFAWKLDEGYKREAQAVDTHHFVKKHNDGLPVVLVGDFNAGPDCTEIRFLTGKQSINGESAYYQDAWDMTHDYEPGYSWSVKNIHTRPWLEPDRRLDYIFVSQPTKDDKGVILDCHLTMTRPNTKGIFPTDHFGVVGEIAY